MRYYGFTDEAGYPTWPPGTTAQWRAAATRAVAANQEPPELPASARTFDLRDAFQYTPGAPSFSAGRRPLGAIADVMRETPTAAPAAPPPAPAATARPPMETATPAPVAPVRPAAPTPADTAGFGKARQRALQLQAEGKTPQDIMRIMQSEGFRVVP